MSFDWREFFILAHDLRNETEECKQRTSIGRAYYYAYNAALNEAKNRGFNPNARSGKAKGVHQKLWRWYQCQGNQDLIALGDSGNTLKGRRTDADYYVVPQRPITPQLVQKQLAETRDFELLLAKVAQTTPPPALP